MIDVRARVLFPPTFLRDRGDVRLTMVFRSRWILRDTTPACIAGILIFSPSQSMAISQIRAEIGALHLIWHVKNEGKNWQRADSLAERDSTSVRGSLAPSWKPIFQRRRFLVEIEMFLFLVFFHAVRGFALFTPEIGSFF